MTWTPTQTPGQHIREQHALLADLERSALIRIARRLPARINSDHLSTLALLSMLAAGLSFATFRVTPWAALGVIVSLFANWFGDSLDGTVARVRGATAAALRLLCRSRDRSRGDGGAGRRPGLFRAHEPNRRR